MSSPAGHAPRRIVLAYSGGLETSCIIPRRKEQFGDSAVITAAVDVGQPDDLSQIEAKAPASGASKAYVIDAREEFLREYATMRLKDELALTYADLVDDGPWISPRRAALDAFVDRTQLPITGEVRLKLYKGSANPVGRTLPFGRYREELAPFGEDDVCRQADADGFIRLFGLGQKVAAERDRRLQEEALEVAR